MFNCNSASVHSFEKRAAASGEVGVLGEEAAQRLLSIFGEAATCCLEQLSELSLQHAASKHNVLFAVGLDLVLKWDSDIASEETGRMELTYPEISALHTYVFLWLLEKLCSNDTLHNPGLPPLGEIYRLFMKRVASHRDVRQGQQFLRSSELVKRSVYVDAFRWVYHDAVQKAIRSHVQQTATHQTKHARLSRDDLVRPDEAASQIGLQQPLTVQALAQDEKTSEQKSALERAMLNEEERVQSQSSRTPHFHPGDLFVMPAREKWREESEISDMPEHHSESVPSPDAESEGTKAVTLQGPCFFKCA